LIDNGAMTPRLLADRATWMLAGGFALLAALLVLVLTQFAAQQRDEALVIHTLDVENRLARVLSRVQDAETGQRGYLITGQADFLEPYHRAAATLGADLDGLAQATSDNPAQRASMARLRARTTARMERLRKGIALRRTGSVEEAAARLALGEGKRLMDQVRHEIAAMRAEEERLLATRQAQSKATSDRVRFMLIAGFVFVVLLMAYAMRLSARRLATLAAGRDELARINAELLAEAASRESAESQLRQMQKMEAVGQLTGGIAHDFNNMLSIIIGSLDLATRRLRNDPDKARACIDNAVEGAQRAASLTGRLLAFSRQQPLAPIVADPNKLVGGMSEMLRRTIGEHLLVETVLAGGVWRIHADVTQLENAVINLCVNARDAMPDGGKLTIETSNAYLDDAYAGQHAEVTPGQYVMISVSDTGTGMPPEVAQRAFDPFYTTKGVGRGTGLGLSQVFGFVKQSGGHVKIYSEAGSGTAVKIYLPRWIGDLAVAQAAPERAAMPVARGTEIVLVVEDDSDVRHVSIDALRHLGYTVVQAGSAAEAMQVLALQPRVDLLFTDIVMPGKTGRVLADEATAQWPGLKVLYTTGYTRNAVVHNGVLDAGVAFLPKPFTIEQLAAKVRQVLDGEGANRPAQAGEADAGEVEGAEPG
jgi:signal transduction histidine kinase/ActR/RegA family two-component response regulator